MMHEAKYEQKPAWWYPTKPNTCPRIIAGSPLLSIILTNSKKKIYQNKSVDPSYKLIYKLFNIRKAFKITRIVLPSCITTPKPISILPKKFNVTKVTTTIIEKIMFCHVILFIF